MHPIFKDLRIIDSRDHNTVLQRAVQKDVGRHPKTGKKKESYIIKLGVASYGLAGSNNRNPHISGSYLSGQEILH